MDLFLWYLVPLTPHPISPSFFAFFFDSFATIFSPLQTFLPAVLILSYVFSFILPLFAFLRLLLHDSVVSFLFLPSNLFFFHCVVFVLPHFIFFIVTFLFASFHCNPPPTLVVYFHFFFFIVVLRIL